MKDGLPLSRPFTLKPLQRKWFHPSLPPLSSLRYNQALSKSSLRLKAIRLNSKSNAPSLSPARPVALRLLRQWRSGSRYADDLLDEALRRESLTSEDRALVQELFYGVLRHQLYLDFLLDAFARQGLHSLPGEVQDILRLSLYPVLYLTRIPDYAIVDEACRLTRRVGQERLVKVVNGLLRAILRRRNDLPAVPGAADSPEHLSIRYSVPEWIVRRFLKEFGSEETVRLMRWAQSRPPLTLRVNPRRMGRAQLIARVREAGIEAEAHPDVETALAVQARGAITELPGFREGWWQVQDASAQEVVPFLEIEPGLSVWDACAAPGGKTLQIGEMLEGNGSLWVSDPSFRRLSPLQENWERLHGGPIRIWAGDVLQPPLRPGTLFDRILLDVPCSGLGVLSRRVDLRYRVREEDIARLAETQFEILTEAARWLRPGGIIVYSTCTLLSEENRDVIERFLAQTIQFRREPVTDEGDWLILPEAGRRDGAFASRLRRK
jgi:16S rRNA (cytosine967-C5)-methyltransferase